jgi:pimeloyl-ACP methyl ester carboxylesterase
MQIRTGSTTVGHPDGDLELYYEDMGDVDDPAVLLIMGLGAQLLQWRPGFCEKLVARGLRVIRYDNRDVGLPSQAPYGLEDMADDAAAVLDHLGIDSAHIVGASMGGMIAQVFAARFTERTSSLAIIFSSNNQRFLPPPAPRALRAILTGPPPGSPRDVIIDNAVRVSAIIGSPRYRSTEEQVRADAAEGFDRSYYPSGVARHFDAILNSGSLVHYNRRTAAPTVVIHGRADKLMRPFGARAVARSISGSRLVLIDGMAHDLPPQLWDRVIGVLGSNFAEAGVNQVVRETWA